MCNTSSGCGPIPRDAEYRLNERPAQRKAIAESDVDILDARVDFGHKAKHLREQRPLQTVHDEPVDLAFHHDWRMAGRAQHRSGALDRRGVSPRSRDYFSGRDKIRRIDWVNDEPARAALERFSESGRKDRRSRTRKHRVRRSSGV